MSEAKRTDPSGVDEADSILHVLSGYITGRLSLDQMSEELRPSLADRSVRPGNLGQLLDNLGTLVDRRSTRAGEWGWHLELYRVYSALKHEREFLHAARERFARVPQGTSADVLPYLDLMRSLLSGEIDAPTFDRQYWALHGKQDFFLPDGMYPTMQEVFYAAEDYVEYEHLREPGDLDDDGLRARVAELEPELRRLYDEARAREDPPSG